MTNREQESLAPPTTTQIFWSPERAIIAALDANLLMASRMLDAQQPASDDDEEDPNDAPLLIMARSIIATAASLRRLLAGYDEIAERIVQRDCYPQPLRASPKPAGTCDDDPIF